MSLLDQAVEGVVLVVDLAAGVLDDGVAAAGLGQRVACSWR